jgi:hypothetical protein
MWRGLVLIVSVVLSCASTARADQLTFRNGVDEYNSQTDLCIYNQPFNDQWRTDGVRSDGTLGLDGDGIAQSLVRFGDIIGTGPGQIAPGALIESATLTLYTATTSTDPGSGGRIRAYRMTSPWDQDSDWTTFEAWGGTEGITLAGEFVSVKSVGVSNRKRDPNDIDLTDALQAWADGASNYGVGLMFSTLTFDAADLSSSSDIVDYRPLLTVNYTVPEPATGLLLCIGGSLIANRRSRQ